MTYTVQGKPLRACSLDELRREAEAGHWLKARGATNSNGWAKLEAVEREIAFRSVPAPTSTCIEHAYGTTTRLTFQIKVF